MLALATFNVAVQLSAPRWVVARALSLYQMAAFGGIAGGSWLWGVVAERESIMFSLLACAVVLLACAASRGLAAACAIGGPRSRPAADIGRNRRRPCRSTPGPGRS